MPRLSPSLLRKLLVAAGLCLGVVWAAVGRFCYGGAYHAPALWLLLAAALVLALRAVRRRWLAVAAAGLCMAAALFWLNAPAYTVKAAVRSLRRQFTASAVQFAGCVTATPRRPLIRYDVYCFFVGDQYSYFEPDSGQYIEMGAKDVWQTA